MSDATYRALPVRRGPGPMSVETLGGTFDLTGVHVVELREYQGGELAVILDTTGADWSWDETTVEGAELWVYGTRRVEVEASGDFLAQPRQVEHLSTDPTLDLRVGGGRVVSELSHAVLRIR